MRKLLFLTALLVPFASAQTVPATGTVSATGKVQYGSAAQAASEAARLSGLARQTYAKNTYNIDQTLWSQAADAAEQAVNLDPRNAEYLKLRAQIYTDVGFWKQAETAWNAYFQHIPAANTPEAAAAATVQYNLGYAAYRRGQSSDASLLFASCLTLNPQNADCATWSARTALENGQYQQATDLYERALTLRPNDKTLSYFAGLSRKASTYGPAATAAFSRAYQHLEAGKTAEAILGFQEAASAAPNFVEAWRELGRLSLGAGDAQTALRAYQAAAALPSATASDRYNLTVAQEGAQYGLAAVQTYRSGYGKYTAGNKAEAEAAFLSATTQSPTYAKAWAWLGRVRYEAGNYAGAAEAYAKAVELNPADKSSAYYLKLAEQGK